MPVTNTTANRGYQLPHASNLLDFDVARLISSLNAIDVDVANFLTVLTTKAPLDNANLTGTPTVPTVSAGDNSTKPASTAWVRGFLSDFVGSAPGTLDTIGEIAAALQNNPDVITELLAAVGERLRRDQNLADLTDVAAARGSLDVYSKDDIAAAVQTLTNKTLIEPIITLQQGSNVSPTDEGHIEWDHNNNAIVVGTGGATKVFAGLPVGVAAGDLLYLSGTRTLARLAKGAAGQRLTMDAGATAPAWLSENRYISPQQTLTLNTTVTLAHGLGAKPDLWKVTMVCTTAEHGYAVGEDVDIYFTANSASVAGWGVVPSVDATNIYLITGANAVIMMSKTTRQQANATPANWKLRAMAWRF